MGSWALIWPADVASSGIGALFSVTHAPPSTVGSVAVLNDAVLARLRPMMAIRPLGAIAGRKLAAFTTPLAATEGALLGCGASSGMMLNPDSVSTNAMVPDASTAMARPRMLRRAPARATTPGPSRPGEEARV